MSAPSLSILPIPAGGAVLLVPQSTATDITITRTTVGTGVVATVYNGAYNDNLRQIDFGAGQGVNAPLDQTLSYTYTITDVNGSYTSPAITPALFISVDDGHFTEIIIKLFENGLKTLALPAGFNKPQILHAMPIDGFPALPAIHIYQDYIHSEQVPIGQQVSNPDVNNTWTFPTIVNRHFLVTALTTSPIEREFYRTAIIAIFLSVLSNPIAQLGNNISHSFDSSSSQVHKDGEYPGFYYTDVGISFTGTFNVSLTTSYSLVEAYSLGLTIQSGSESVTVNE